MDSSSLNVPNRTIHRNSGVQFGATPPSIDKLEKSIAEKLIKPVQDVFQKTTKEPSHDARALFQKVFGQSEEKHMPLTANYAKPENPLLKGKKRPPMNVESTYRRDEDF